MLIPADASEARRTEELLAAASHVYTNYYSKPYPEPPSDAPDAYQMDLKPQCGVEKPNHALANALRKAALVPAVAEEYHQSVSHKSFIFNPREILAMQFAMVFEVCGRLSDIGFNDDPDEFMRYHEASWVAFESYSRGRFEETVLDTALEALQRMYVLFFHPPRLFCACSSLAILSLAKRFWGKRRTQYRA